MVKALFPYHRVLHGKILDVAQEQRRATHPTEDNVPRGTLPGTGWKSYTPSQD